MSLSDECALAVEAGLIKQDHADAILACFVHHDDGAVSMDISGLTQDQRNAMDALILMIDEDGE